MLKKTPWITVLLMTGLVLLTGLIFALRYNVAFTEPNFYAEDATIFLKNIFEHGPWQSTFTAFNGYLVVGQYLVIDGAYIIYLLFNLPFASLPFLISLMSCIFLGITVSLPFILFRKELGYVVAITTSVVLAFTPVPGSDYAIIGTIGNLKFAFLFWAVLLVIYRNLHTKNTKRVVAIDLLLLLAVLTYGPTIALLPFILWPYRTKIWSFVKSPYLIRYDLDFFKRIDVLSMFALAVISGVYVTIVYLKGVPIIDNYLPGPFNIAATDNIIYRVTLYSWLFPISQISGFVMSLASGVLATIFTVLLALFFGWVYFVNKRGRLIFSFGLFAIFSSTLAFVATRPGVGGYMLQYLKFPDQFFYAQSLVFVFMTMWIVAPYVRTRKKEIIFVVIASIYLLISAQFGSSWGSNLMNYQQRGNIYDNTSKICRSDSDNFVSIPVYPTEGWDLTLERKIACS